MTILNKIAKNILNYNYKFEDIETILANIRIHNDKLAEEVLEEILAYFFEVTPDGKR